MMIKKITYLSMCFILLVLWCAQPAAFAGDAYTINAEMPIPDEGLAVWTTTDNGEYTLDEQGRVTSWLNKANGTNHFTSPNESTRPTIKQNGLNRHKTLSFDGTNRLALKYDTPYIGDSTIFIVFKIREPYTQNSGLFTTSPGGALAHNIDMLLLNTGIMQYRSNNPQADPNHSSWPWFTREITSFHVGAFRVTQNFDDSQNWVNSMVLPLYDGVGTEREHKTPNYKFNTHTGYLVASRGNNDAASLNCEIAEFIVYHRSLSDSEMTDVQQYLDEKYRTENKYEYTNITNTPAANGKADLSATLTNKSLSSLTDAVAIPAIYDGNLLVSKDIQKGTSVSGGSSATISALGLNDTASENKETKFYLWNSLENMRPLSFDAPAPAPSDFVPVTGAEDKVVINKELIFDGNSVTLTGVTPAGKDKKITVLAKLSEQELEKDNIYYLGEDISGEGGQFSHTFTLPDYFFDGTPLSSKFDLYAGGEDTNRSALSTFSMVSGALKKDLVEKINEAKTDSELAALFDPSSSQRTSLEAVGVNMTTHYDNMKTAGKAYIRASVLKSPDYNEDNSGEIAVTINNAYPYALFCQSESVSETNDCLAAYGTDIFGLQTKNSKVHGDLTAAEQTAAASYVLYAMPFNFENQTTFLNIYQLGYAFYELNNSSYVKIETVMSQCKDLLGLTTNSDYTKYTGMSSAGREYVNKELVKEAYNSPFTTIAELATSLDKAVNSYVPPKIPSNPGNSYSGNSSTYMTMSNENKTPEVSEEIPAEISIPFNDLGTVSWAVPAIEALFSRQIVSGKSAESFAPGDNVTREEFVKMIVTAFDLSVSQAECNFSDVNEGDWYYSYVASAVNSGIINGMSTSEFGTGNSITRQDIAVIAARLLDRSGKNIASDGDVLFDDDRLIADYAKTAVEKMRGTKIMNGKDNNLFDPAAPCTRAESAVLIFNLINALK